MTKTKRTADTSLELHESEVINTRTIENPVYPEAAMQQKPHSADHVLEFYSAQSKSSR